MDLGNQLAQSSHFIGSTRALLPSHVHVMTTQKENTFLWHTGMICKGCPWPSGETGCPQPCLATTVLGSISWHTSPIHSTSVWPKAHQGGTLVGLGSTHSNNTFTWVTPEFLTTHKVIVLSWPMDRGECLEESRSLAGFMGCTWWFLKRFPVALCITT